MQQLERTDEPLLASIAHTGAGLEEAWRLMHDRIPSTAFDRRRRNASPAHAAPPLRDPEIAGPYLAAQRALRYAYHRLVAHGGDAFWPQESTYGPDDLIDPLLLCGALAGIRRQVDRLDSDARRQLLVAERKLKPFWREPPPLRKCRTCRTKPAAGDRKDCWTCSSRRRTKRQVRVQRVRR